MAWTAVKIFGLLFCIGSINSTKIPKIVGGSNASIKSFPFLVSIREDGSHFCTGSIISRRHILTAAHCVWGEDKNDLKIHSGATRSDETGNVHLVEAIHMHPSYDSDDNGWYDLAVLTLTKPIDFDERQHSINLPSHDIEEYQTAYVLGWGRMVNTWVESNGKPLQKLKVALLPSYICQSYIQTKIDRKQICAFRSVTKGSCAGDSGGPLVADDQIVGIVSRGDISNCVDGHPDINTNVYAFKSFIQHFLNE